MPAAGAAREHGTVVPPPAACGTGQDEALASRQSSIYVTAGEKQRGAGQPIFIRNARRRYETRSFGSEAERRRSRAPCRRRSRGERAGGCSVEQAETQAWGPTAAAAPEGVCPPPQGSPPCCRASSCSGGKAGGSPLACPTPESRAVPSPRGSPSTWQQPRARLSPACPNTVWVDWVRRAEGTRGTAGNGMLHGCCSRGAGRAGAGRSRGGQSRSQAPACAEGPAWPCQGTAAGAAHRGGHQGDTPPAHRQPSGHPPPQPWQAGTAQSPTAPALRAAGSGAQRRGCSEHKPGGCSAPASPAPLCTTPALAIPTAPKSPVTQCAREHTDRGAQEKNPNLP